MSSFAPTALLVMAHNVTGLKYFCKTTRLNKLCSYKGSGKYWKRHISKHGANIEVCVLGVYYDKQRCTEAALKFSYENNIVESTEWANLIVENGLDGAGAKEAHHAFGKPSPCRGQKRPQTSAKLKGSLNPMYGKQSPLRGVSKPKGKDSPLYGRKRPEGGGKPSKPVIRDDGKTYKSISEAAKDVNGHGTTISSCCLGKSKTAYGFNWRYL